MALSYALELGAPAAVTTVNAAMTRVAATHQLIDTEPAHFDQSYVFLASGVQVSTRVSTPPPFLDPVTEHYGFAPTANVVFRHSHTCDSDHQDLDTIRLVVAILTDIDGDALLMFNGELVMLARIAGRLTVDPSKLWNPDMLALLPPHEVGDLPDM